MIEIRQKNDGAGEMAEFRIFCGCCKRHTVDVNVEACQGDVIITVRPVRDVSKRRSVEQDIVDALIRAGRPLSIQEISQVTGRSEGTVKKTISRSKGKIGRLGFKAYGLIS